MAIDFFFNNPSFPQNISTYKREEGLSHSTSLKKRSIGLTPENKLFLRRLGFRLKKKNV